MIKAPTLQDESSANALNQLRERFIYVLIAIAFFTAVGGVIAQIITGLVDGSVNITEVTLTAAFALGAVAARMLLRQRRVRLASILLFVTLIASYLIINLPEVLLLLGVLTIVGSALLSPLWLFVVVNVIVIGKPIYLFGDLMVEQGMAVSLEGIDLTIRISTLIVIGVVTRFFVDTAERTAQKSQRNADLLHGASEIGQITSKLLDLDELFARAIELIQDRFAFYHVQLFIVDENRDFAVLRASTGSAGQQLIEKGHKLEVGSQSVIGQVTQTGEPLIVRDTDTNPVHARNELLPSTRAELALPIFDGNVIMGALDVQSTRPDAFVPTDVQALQVMSNQLGVAIRNARLFHELTRNLEDNKRLLLEKEASLRENQRLYRQLTENVWYDYLAENESIQGMTLRDNALEQGATWTAAMLDATRRQRPSRQTTEEGQQLVAVPIVLRGQPIGAMEVKTSHKLSEDEIIDLMQAISQRLAISLDNARLIDDIQKTAVQEQRINKIAEQYQTASSVDDLLQITLNELSQSLNAQQGTIRLAMLDETTPQDDRYPESSGQNGHYPNGGGQHD